MTGSSNGKPQHELRSFGRRRGRGPSPRQRRLLDETLPRVAIEPADQAGITALLSNSPETWLEIGFGGGEHLLWQASQNPGIAIIGCEPFEGGVVKVLSAIEEHSLNNIRVVPDDARPLLRVLPSSSIGRLFILFPDPWPKRKHVKRRLVARPLLDQLARVMRPGAELRLATDIGDYARTMLNELMGHTSFRWTAQRPADWRQRPSDWPETRYERKAMREGRRGYFLRFTRA